MAYCLLSHINSVNEVSEDTRHAWTQTALIHHIKPVHRSLVSFIIVVNLLLKILIIQCAFLPLFLLALPISNTAETLLRSQHPAS